MPGVLSHQQIQSVLTEGRQAYLAVDAPNGPHVTPDLYGVVDDHLGMWVATSTVKARVLKKSRAVGVLVRTAAGTVVMSGTGEVLDPLRPPLNPGRLFGAGRVTANFAVRNAADLVAFGRDTVAGATGFPPARRVLVLARPERLASLTASGEVTYTAGGWPGPPGEPAEDPFVSDVVVGLLSPVGPMALPGRWLGDGRVEVPGQLATLAGVGDGPVSVTADDYVEPGPAAKRGVILRGEGQLIRDEDRLVVVIDPDRRTEWDGVRTSTRPVADRPEAADLFATPD